MASSSKSRAVASSSRVRPASDVFRPRFPIDPFAGATHREPWYLRYDSLPSLSFQSRRDVILVLGAPTPKALEPLLSAKSLSSSLLIIATHEPLQIHHTTVPTVRILHLKESLAVEDAGAVRFVNVLEWAERVARLWRKYGGYGAVTLSENNDGNEHLPSPSVLGFRATQSTPPSPRTSTSHLSSDDRPPRPRSVSSRFLGRSRHPSLPTPDPSQRPFDGIINFLPGNVPEKALLKQSILVTTISKPFLISTASPTNDRDRKRKFRLSSRSVSTVYLPPTPPYQSGESLLVPSARPSKAHIVHVLPHEARSYTRSKFVQSLESFLVSFGYPSPKDVSSQDMSNDRPRPYIMTLSCLNETVRSSPSSPTSSPYESWPSDCSLVELVLCGSLDGEDSPPQLSSVTQHQVPRAFLTSASDVVILAESAPTPPSITVSHSEPTQGRPTGWRMKDRYSSTSSASSCPPPVHGRSSSSGSPLGKTARHNSLGDGLPTPPDSDESGLDEDKMVSIPRVDSIETDPSCGKDEPSAPLRKSRTMRWKFWKRSARIPA